MPHTPPPTDTTAHWQAELNAALAELSSGLLSSLTLEAISTLVVSRAQALTSSPYAFTGYIDATTGNLVCPTLTREVCDRCQIPDPNTIFSKFSGLWGWVLQNRQPLLTNTPHGDPRSTGVPEGHIPINRFLAVPAIVDEELVGIIALANSERNYTEQDLAALAQIATLFALAIQRTRNEEAMQRLLVGTAAVTGERFFATAVEQLAKCLGTKYVILGEILPGACDRVHGLAFWNGDGPGEPFDYPLAGSPCDEASRRGFCMFHEGIIEQFPEDQILEEWNIQFYAGIPLHAETGGIIGVLCALHDHPPRKTPHIAEIFQIFSNRASAEIERKRAEDDLARAKEAAEKANRAKNKFLATMSHELRTPLNAIIGFAGVLQEQHFGPLNDRQLEYSGDIRKSGLHLLTLINNILDLSKIESGKMLLTQAPVCLADLITQSVSAVEQDRKVELSIDPELKNLVVEMDQRRLQQAITYLIDNAVKFTPPEGQIKISGRCLPDSITIAVADTGIGIAARDLDDIFKPFYQAHNEYRNKSPGIGLGLALCKALVEMHGGTVVAESAGLQKGACFTIRIPIREPGFGRTQPPQRC